MSLKEEEQGLLKAITGNLDDDTPRVAYADWLDEQANESGHPEYLGRDPQEMRDRAEFIRVQISIATERDVIRGMSWTPELAAEFTAREVQFLQACRDELEAPTRDAIGASCTEVTFHRGFPHNVTVKDVQGLIDSGILESNTNTLTGVAVTVLEGQLSALLSYSGIANLAALDLASNHIRDAGAAAIAASKNLVNLTALDLASNHIGPAGAAAIAASRNFPNLTVLNLASNYIGDAGAEAIAASQNLANLTVLNLASNYIGDAGAEAIAASQNLANLTRLNLSYNSIGDAGAEAIAVSQNLANLTRLDLSYNSIGPAGAIAIAVSQNLANLTRLNLRHNYIEHGGASAIAASPNLSTSAKLSALRSAGFTKLADQVEHNAQGRYDGRQ